MGGPRTRRARASEEPASSPAPTKKSKKDVSSSGKVEKFLSRLASILRESTHDADLTVRYGSYFLSAAATLQLYFWVATRPVLPFRSLVTEKRDAGSYLIIKFEKILKLVSFTRRKSPSQPPSKLQWQTSATASQLSRYWPLT